MRAAGRDDSVALGAAAALLDDPDLHVRIAACDAVAAAAGPVLRQPGECGAAEALLAARVAGAGGASGGASAAQGLYRRPAAQPAAAEADDPAAEDVDVDVEVSDDDALAVRDRAMLELFYSSGLRLAELTSLAPEDINFADATVRVTGKGGKTRIVPVGSHAATALRAWLEQRDALPGVDANALFVNRQGRRLGPRAIQSRVQQRGLRQGIAARVHPHMLRHSFASHVLQSSSDLRAVQEMLGHSSISTTQVYTQLDFQHLAKIYDAAHPRAKRKDK
jgi:integrase/recombinase XerC